MAGKKPAKPIAGQNRDKGPQLPGKAVKFFGAANTAPFVCPTCSRELTKGIVYEDNSKMYCKRGCIPSVKESA